MQKQISSTGRILKLRCFWLKRRNNVYIVTSLNSTLFFLQKLRGLINVFSFSMKRSLVCVRPVGFNGFTYMFKLSSCSDVLLSLDGL